MSKEPLASTSRKRPDGGADPRSRKRRKLERASKANRPSVEQHGTAAGVLVPDPTAESEFHAYDVLWGRDSIVYKHYGNLYFRRLVRTHRNAYQTATKRKQKGHIVRLILDSIHDKGGRFLKQRQEGESDQSSVEGTDSKGWIEVSAQDAYTKVGHALRSCKGSDTSSPSNTPPANLSADSQPEGRGRATARAETAEFMAALAHGLSTTEQTPDECKIASKEDSEWEAMKPLQTSNLYEPLALTRQQSVPDQASLPFHPATLSLLHEPIRSAEYSTAHLSENAASFAEQFFSPPRSQHCSIGQLAQADSVSVDSTGQLAQTDPSPVDHSRHLSGPSMASPSSLQLNQSDTVSCSSLFPLPLVAAPTSERNPWTALPIIQRPRHKNQEQLLEQQLKQGNADPQQRQHHDQSPSSSFRPVSPTSQLTSALLADIELSFEPRVAVHQYQNRDQKEDEDDRKTESKKYLKRTRHT